MFIFLYIITCVIFGNSADMDTIISDEKFASNPGESIRKAAKISEDTPRRFIEELSDKDFHIAHLKDADWHKESGKKHCQYTFEDKVKRYKNMLANDPSRLKFVSADALPFNEKDLITEKCLEDEEKRDGSSAKVDRAAEEKTDTATTPDIKDKKVKKKPGDPSRRASEYLFSSVEYYDDVPGFDAAVCPDDVTEIVLEVDIIKPYDMECELLLRWESLD